MKNAAILIVTVYVLALCTLTVPVVWLSFQFPGPLPGPSEWYGVFVEETFWMFLGVMVLGQIVLLLVPIKVGNQRPTRRRSVYLPIIAAGFFAACLFFAVILALLEFFQKSLIEVEWHGWTAVGVGVVFWIGWTIVFFRITRDREPRDVVSRQCRHLLQGSALALLVAVPTHIIARQREYCCAGFGTFVGIALGIAVMLMAFGPGVLFLYADRWRRLHPKPEPIPTTTSLKVLEPTSVVENNSFQPPATGPWDES